MRSRSSTFATALAKRPRFQANRRVAVLVLEAVSPADTTTARTQTDTPATLAPGLELADAGSATNRLLYRVPPAELGKTVLVKDPKPAEPPKSE